MNAELRALGAMEIKPLKEAMMKAVERADEMWPPLHVSGKHSLEPFNDLKLAIDKVTIDDGQLRTLMGDFMTACTNADGAWFKASATIPQEYQSGDAIKAVYVDKFGGKKLAERVRNEYVTLSKYLETLLA
jgi:hypothetical protein